MAADLNRAGLTTAREAQGYVAGDGIRLAFGYWPGRGAPLVALHGITASYLSFAGLAERLSGRRAVFALDLRGRGGSDMPSGPFGMAQHARDVAAAMDALGLGASVIVGHSMGGFVATALAQQAPQLVAGLVLIDGGFAPALSTPSSAQGLDAALALRIQQLRQAYPSRHAYQEFWRNQPHFPSSVWNPWIEAFLDYEIDGEPPALRPRASEEAVRVDLMDGLDRETIIHRCRGIRVPVLMLRAPAGFVPGSPPLYPDGVMEQMQTCIPHMEQHLIPDTTHYTILLGVRGATALADLINEFAARCLRAPEVHPV